MIGERIKQTLAQYSWVHDCWCNVFTIAEHCDRCNLFRCNHIPMNTTHQSYSHQGWYVPNSYLNLIQMCLWCSYSISYHTHNYNQLTREYQITFLSHIKCHFYCNAMKHRHNVRGEKLSRSVWWCGRKMVMTNFMSKDRLQAFKSFVYCISGMCVFVALAHTH